MFLIWNKIKNKLLDEIERCCSHSIVINNNIIYLIGGGKYNLNSFQHLNEIWKITNNFKNIIKLELFGDYFVGRRGHSSLYFKENLILIYGGFITQNSHPSSNSTSNSSNSNSNSSMNDEGNNSNQSILSNDLYVFNCETLFIYKINQKGKIPYPRRGHIASIYENKMILFGGDTEYLNQYMIYDSMLN